MKTEQLTTLALRVVAIIIMAYAFMDLTNIVAFLLLGLHWMRSRDAALAAVGEYAVILWSIPIVMALLLWWLAPSLARLACGGTGSEVNALGADIERLTHGAFIVVGVWILVFGFINLVRIGVNELQITSNPKMWGNLFPWGQFAAYVLRCLFGLVLILGGRNLSRFLLHLRTVGTEQG